MKKLFYFIAFLIPFISFSQNEWNNTSNSTSAMYRSGNVAIGVTSAISNIPFVVKSSSNGTKVLFGGTSFVGSPTASHGLLQLQSNNATLLDLRANVTASKNYSAVFKISSSGLELNYDQVGYSAIPFIIKGNGTERLRIDPSGKVGIGTGSASLGSCKLAVDGVIGCRELKVTLATPWPDYVFEKKYERMSLNDIENYLTTNKHLPYLPSAQTIEKETESTFNVGETQVGMLRSLEELYLHVLDLKKENDQLRAEIEILKQQK